MKPIMGYESKLYIGKLYEKTGVEPTGDGAVDKLFGLVGSKWFDFLCEYDLRGTGYKAYNHKLFRDVFETEVDFADCLPDGVSTDKYGDTCRYADPREVVSWLEAFSVDNIHDRVPTLVALLNCIIQQEDAVSDKFDGDSLFTAKYVVVHYGY